MIEPSHSKKTKLTIETATNAVSTRILFLFSSSTRWAPFFAMVEGERQKGAGERRKTNGRERCKKETMGPQRLVFFSSLFLSFLQKLTKTGFVKNTFFFALLMKLATSENKKS